MNCKVRHKIGATDWAEDFRMQREFKGLVNPHSSVP